MTVQSNIPAPKRFKTRNMLVRLNFFLPWDTIKVGESFFIPGATRVDRPNIWVSASRRNISIQTDITEEGMRVWRV